MKILKLTKSMFAVVDDDRFEELNAHLWNAKECNGRFYAARSFQNRILYLHRYLMGIPDGEVDHVNGLTLDNRVENLRLASRANNMFNTIPSRISKSGFVGVRQNACGTFTAYLTSYNRQLHVGTFSDAVTAAKARDAKAKELRGEFVVLNFQTDGVVNERIQRQIDEKVSYGG